MVDTMMQSPMTLTESKLFEEHCREAVLGLRGAILDLYREIGVDPAKPQDVARRFKLNKNLTWKLARIVQEENAFSAVPLIPGAGGMDIFLEAMSEAGASEPSIERTRGALDAFERMVKLHVGDRAALDLMLDSMGQTPGQLEKSRKLAYRGNTGIWGVHARTRVTAQFLAPSRDDPSMLDAAQIAGLEGVQRLRRIPRWPVFRIGRYATAPTPGNRIPIDPGEADRPGLIGAGCRGHMPEIHMLEKDDGITYQLGDGPVGRTGEFSCAFGFVHRAFVPRYAKSDDRSASLYSAVSMPVEAVLFDLFVHRDLPEAMNATAAVYGQFWGEMGVVDDAARLPIHERVVDLGRGASVATPLVNDYTDIIALTFERAGWTPQEFHCLRLVVEYPPVPSTVVMRFDLKAKPHDG